MPVPLLPDLPPLDPVPLPPVAAAEDQVERAWQERDYRRSQRARRRLGVRNQPRCPSCRLFKRGAALCEHCGHTDIGPQG